MHQLIPIRVLALCIMPTHFHLVLWPRSQQELTEFMRRLTQRHAQRWHHAHNSVGFGSVYQGRFKSFVVKNDSHLLILCRYVERNVLRAKLVRRAEQWRWCSAWVRGCDDPKLRQLLCDWPVDRPSDWLRLLNEPQTPAEERAIRLSLARGRPFGDAEWVERTARKLGLEQTLRSPGRPLRAS